MNEKQIKKLTRNIISKAIIGVSASIASFVLCFVFFGWKLALIFLLYELGNNMWKSIHDIKDKVDIL